MIQYAIQSKLNNNFLSHLFENEHEKMFREPQLNPDKIYLYNSKLIAQDVAAQNNATVIEVKEKNYSPFDDPPEYHESFAG